MKIWINKGRVESPSTNDFVVFNIDIPGVKGGISSNIRNGWYRQLGRKLVPSIYEDLYIIALSIFAVDKRILRSSFPDVWTRMLEMNIPVLEYEKWNKVADDLNVMISYLSGDEWNISFRPACPDYRYADWHKRNKVDSSILNDCTCVSLFSGGLDSYCGAHYFLSHNEKVIFVGYKEYDKLRDIQGDLYDSLIKAYPDTESELFRFTAKARAPLGLDYRQGENTSRSRSFLFLSAALCIAGLTGRDIPVYVPENGFIGLNLPMTDGRKGSCSTRTTHPYFIRMFNDFLKSVGINNKIINPFAFNTKREMVRMFSNNTVFVENVANTISCSHPRNGRWQGITVAENCGYCYPCLIRQSSLLDLKLSNEHYANNVISLEYIMGATHDTKSDLIDLIASIYHAEKATDEELLERISYTGKLTQSERIKFLRVYRSTISDLMELFHTCPALCDYMGI